MCKSALAKAAHGIQSGSMEHPEESSDTDIFSIGSTKNSLKKVKINNSVVLMQIDSSFGGHHFAKKWNAMGQPSLWPTTHWLKQFNGSAIRTLGQFEALVEWKEDFAVDNVIVAECNKPHGSLSTDVLNIDFSAISVENKEVNNHYTESCSIGCLYNFQAHIVLKEHAQSSYFEPHPLPIHIRPLVIKKLNEMIKDGILEKVLPGGSKWASPMVIVRKSNGDLQVCADYKVGINPKICSDSFPMPNVETAFSALASMQYFTKIDLASAYNQLQLDKDSRTITTMNTLDMTSFWHQDC